MVVEVGHPPTRMEVFAVVATLGCLMAWVILSTRHEHPASIPDEPSP